MASRITGGVRTSLLLMVLTAVNSSAGQRPPTAPADLGDAWQPIPLDAARSGNGLVVDVRFDVLRQAAATPSVLTLPLADGTTVRLAVQWSHSDAREVAVAGPLVDGVGEASLTVVDDAVSGRVVVNNRLFMVRRLRDSTAHFVSEVDQAALRPEAPPRVVPETTGEPMPDLPAAAGDSNAFVDLMILYTPASRAAMGGTSAIVAELVGAVNNANFALSNSVAMHRFRLVHYAEVAYTETGAMGTTLDHLTFTGDGMLDNVHALRNQYRADVVTLLSNDANACGLGWLMGPSLSPTFEAFAFNVVAWDCANGNLTLAHEIGHNMGLHHDRPNAGSSSPAFPYAYGYTVNGLARDVMAYDTDCPNGCPRRQIYSTPLRFFPGTGVLAGTANEDNTRALNGTSMVVANFRQSLCTVAVSSPSANFPSGGGSGTVNVTSTDPFCTWSAASSNGAVLTVTSGASGTGNGTVSYAVAANAGPASRTATLTIADKTVTIFQLGRNNLGDVDGDGRSEIAVYRPSAGSWHLLTSATNFTGGAGYSWGASSDLPLTGDFDGDGKNDLVVYRQATGHWFVLTSRSSYTAYVIYQWGGSGDKPVPADYDGDGRADFAVYRPSTGTWYVLTSSTGYTSAFGYAWGLTTDVPVPGDYDGDARADLVVYRPGSGHWFVLTSSSNYTAYVIYQWGAAGDIPVPANYDGDTRTDVAVYRPSTGTWFLLTSNSGFSAGAFYTWGVSSDVPVPADYDGDGRTDIAVFRPSTAHWFILKSTSNFAAWDIYQWGTAGDIPVLRRQ